MIGLQTCDSRAEHPSVFKICEHLAIDHSTRTVTYPSALPFQFESYEKHGFGLEVYQPKKDRENERLGCGALRNWPPKNEQTGFDQASCGLVVFNIDKNQGL